MGIYQKKPYVTKTGKDPMTKKIMVELIADALGYEYEQLEGMEKAPKAVLGLMYKRIMKDYSVY